MFRNEFEWLGIFDVWRIQVVKNPGEIPIRDQARFLSL